MGDMVGNRKYACVTAIARLQSGWDGKEILALFTEVSDTSFYIHHVLLYLFVPFQIKFPSTITQKKPNVSHQSCHCATGQRWHADQTNEKCAHTKTWTAGHSLASYYTRRDVLRM